MKAKLVTIAALALLLCACSKTEKQPQADTSVNEITVVLSDAGVQVDGAGEGAVYTAKNIVYYEAGKGIAYGEGGQEDAHTPEEAQAHTVVHIAKAGTYRLSGKLSKGQIAVDLGEDAKENPEAVVTLIFDGVDITCEVAPAVIFYNVYECADTEKATKDVDTAKAGANVVLADGSKNTVNGGYVARIYKPDTVELNEDGTQVVEAKKLHKYDGAFYSKMSMNVGGEQENTGSLDIHAENEGLDSEMHLTVNGGNINIFSGNDGINTNEDGISVTTVNGGKLSITVTGETGEGDGIDSNGWLVINGGTVIAQACSNSADAGIDSDMGIHINGGTVIATGSMLDRIEDGGQTYAVFSFAQKQTQKEVVYLKDAAGKAVLEYTPENAYSVLIYSAPALQEGTYTLWSGDTQLAGQKGAVMGGMGRPSDGQPPKDAEMPEGGFAPPEDFTMPEGQQPPEGMERPEDFTMPEGGFTPPEGQEPPNGFTAPNGERPQRPGNGQGGQGDLPQGSAEKSTEFVIVAGGNMFSNVAP